MYKPKSAWKSALLSYCSVAPTYEEAINLAIPPCGGGLLTAILPSDIGIGVEVLTAIFVATVVAIAIALIGVYRSTKHPRSVNDAISTRYRANQVQGSPADALLSL